MYYKYLLALLVVFPGIVAAQATFKSFVNGLLQIINALIPAVFALTFLVLIWGIVKAWILNAGDTNEIEQGKRLAVIGVIALVIMASIWGILALLRRSLFNI